MSRFFGLLLIGLCMAAGGAAAQDEADFVYVMCIDAGEAEDICECASTALRAEIGDEGYATYGRLGDVYITGKANGMGMIDAWDAAVAAEGLDLSVTNRYGSTHREAIKSCQP